MTYALLTEASPRYPQKPTRTRKISIDIESYKIYYVNYEIRLNASAWRFPPWAH
jgi:hypothetical protein